MKSLGSYLTAGLVGAATAAIVVNAEALVFLIQVAALVSGPVLVLLLFGTRTKARRASEAGDELSRVKRLANPPQPPTPLVLEAERIAREAARRHKPDYPNA